MAPWALHAAFSFRPLNPATPYISHFFGLLERSVGWQIPLVHKSPPHFCFDSGSTCDFEASDRSCIPRKMRDLLSLIFSVLGFSGLGFWFRAKLFLGAERFVDLSTSVLRFEKFAQKCFCFAAAILRAFFLHALSACVLLHGCKSVCISASLDQAMQRDASRFRFPARPTLLHLLPALSRYLPCSLIPPILNLHCIPARVTFVGLHWLSCSTSRWCGLPPSYFISPALLHLLSSAPLAKRLQHHNSSFSVLRTFCLTVVVARRRLGRASSSLSVVCRRLF